jgi:hypothetical protein
MNVILTCLQAVGINPYASKLYKCGIGVEQFVPHLAARVQVQFHLHLQP